MPLPHLPLLPFTTAFRPAFFQKVGAGELTETTEHRQLFLNRRVGIECNSSVGRTFDPSNPKQRIDILIRT